MRDDPLWVSVTELFRSKLDDVGTQFAGHIADPKTTFRYQKRLLKLLGIGDADPPHRGDQRRRS